jgi:nicotinic acid phosphoribosyltransferase
MVTAADGRELIEMGSRRTSEFAAVAAARAAFIAGAGIWYDDSTSTLGANGTVIGTSRDLTVTAAAAAFANAATYAKELRVSAESDVIGTLWIDASRDNSIWRRVKSQTMAAIPSGAFTAEIIHRPSWRYARVGYTNGGGAQARFTLGSVTMAI